MLLLSRLSPRALGLYVAKPRSISETRRATFRSHPRQQTPFGRRPRADQGSKLASGRLPAAFRDSQLASGDFPRASKTAHGHFHGFKCVKASSPSIFHSVKPLPRSPEAIFTVKNAADDPSKAFYVAKNPRTTFRSRPTLRKCRRATSQRLPTTQNRFGRFPEAVRSRA